MSQNASLRSILSKLSRHVIWSFRRWMRSWRIHVKFRCFGKWCLYIRIASIRSMFLSSLPLVYLFFSLNVCLGMLVFLEPFLDGGLLSSRKASRTHGKPKRWGFALCYRSNLKCRLPGRNLFSCHVITVLVKTAFFFSMNSFHTILFSKPRRFTLMKSKMTIANIGF